jgi:minor extracellular serine protease Vpr
VGIVDSGIDYKHPDLGGCFGPGCRVAFGYDFVGGELSH